MAIIYVDSGASGANDGTSWADAFASLASADGAGSSAGDDVYVANTHSESFSADFTLYRPLVPMVFELMSWVRVSPNPYMMGIYKTCWMIDSSI